MSTTISNSTPTPTPQQVEPPLSKRELEEIQNIERKKLAEIKETERKELNAIWNQRGGTVLYTAAEDIYNAEQYPRIDWIQISELPYIPETRNFHINVDTFDYSYGDTRISHVDINCRTQTFKVEQNVIDYTKTSSISVQAYLNATGEQLPIASSETALKLYKDRCDTEEQLRDEKYRRSHLND